ncbi:MAG: class I SAM-dependent methyltransferase [Patescibacteria group bacterium]
MSEVIKKFYNNHNAFGINSTRCKNINTLIKDEVAEGDKKILDVGCATGYLSAPLKINRNQVIGIDIADKSIMEASKKLDEAYVVDIENYPWPKQITDCKYDIIFCTELIEHLFAPEKLLAYLKGLLAKDGIIIITTPNFLVWSGRIKMMLGYYEVWDKGHIRLFCYNTLKRLIDKTGFYIDKEDHVIHPKIPYFIGILRPNLFAYQIVVKLKVKNDID